MKILSIGVVKIRFVNKFSNISMIEQAFGKKAASKKMLKSFLHTRKEDLLL